MFVAGTFAEESDKVIYGLVFPIRTFEVLYVQVSLVVTRRPSSVRPSVLGETFRPAEPLARVSAIFVTTTL